MIEFLLGFILCFIVLYLFSSYFVEVPPPPTYFNSNVDTRVVCDYINESYDHLKDLIFDLDDRLDHLYHDSEINTICDFVEDCFLKLQNLLIEIQEILEQKNNSK